MFRQNAVTTLSGRKNGFLKLFLYTSLSYLQKKLKILHHNTIEDSTKTRLCLYSHMTYMWDTAFCRMTAEVSSSYYFVYKCHHHTIW